MRIGILGGSFDPPHLGHLYMAKTVCRQMNLDRMIIVPSHLNPFKSGNTASPHQRFEMCRLNFETDNEYNFIVSDEEINRSGKSYTYDTLCYFKELFPDDELFLTIGTDLIFDFHRWYRSEDLLRMSDLVCISRDNETKQEDVEEYARNVLKSGNKVHFISIKPFIISSTEIRTRLMNNETVDGCLDEKVYNYVRREGLYEHR